MRVSNQAIPFPDTDEIENPEGEKRFDPSSLLFKDTKETFFLEIKNKNRFEGLKPGDMLVVNRKEKSSDGDLKVLISKTTGEYLVTRNDSSSFEYWGRVIWILKTPN
jgi:SOS-response transcriptional repressor LexA